MVGKLSIGLAGIALAGTVSFAQNADSIETLAIEKTKQYLEKACSGGKERYAVYSPKDNMPVDISIASQVDSVYIDFALLKPLCLQDEVYAFHCHPHDNKVSDFPSGSDFASSAHLRIVCGAEAKRVDKAAPKISNYIINTGRNSEIVKYGFKTDPKGLDKIILAYSAGYKQIRQNASPENLASANKALGALNPQAVRDFRSVIHMGYNDRLFMHIRSVCGEVKTKEAVYSCSALSLDSFIRFLKKDKLFFLERITMPAQK